MNSLNWNSASNGSKPFLFKPRTYLALKMARFDGWLIRWIAPWVAARLDRSEQADE